MIWITEIDNHQIVFQFFDRELPESIAPGKRAKLNHIEYPGGHQTNQIIGVYDTELHWTGLFYGTYNIGGKIITAKQRADELAKLVGKPLRFGFPAAGQGPVPGLDKNIPTSSDKYKGGFTNTYVIEEFIPEIKNPIHIEYSIKLQPHMRQEKIRPDETTSVKVTVNVNNIVSSAKKAHAAGAASKNPVLNNVQNRTENGVRLSGTMHNRYLQAGKRLTYLRGATGKTD